MVNYSSRIIIVRGADLSERFSLIFVGKMCVFVSRPMNIATFLLKNADTPKRVVDFPLERGHIPKQNHGNRRGTSTKKSYNNNGKPWKL